MADKEQEDEVKAYLIQIKADAGEKARGYLENEPKDKDEAVDFGHAVGQLELSENMLHLFYDEE